MDKRYQVFISSTFSDLEEERKLVMEAILECNCFPAGMEMFPAIDIEQFEYIKSIIAQSDYYILIIAGRYGTLASDGSSYTEKEYDYAVMIGIPVLVFLKKDIETIPANKIDGDILKKKKLLDFREKVGKNRLLQTWDNPYELKSKIMFSLLQAFKIRPRTGWVRGDSLNDKIPDIKSTINKHITTQSGDQTRKLPASKTEFYSDNLFQKIYIEYYKKMADGTTENYQWSTSVYKLLQLLGEQFITGVSKKVFESQILQSLNRDPEVYKIDIESREKILDTMKKERIIVDKGEQDLIIFTARSKKAYYDNIAK